MFGAAWMTVNLDVPNRVIDHFGPHAIVVNMRADSATMVVVLRAELVDAILGSITPFQEIFLGVVMEEDVHIAFDLHGS